MQNITIFSQQPYLARYGLKEAPYSTKPNERYLYLTNGHQEALATVGKTIQDREGAALVYGKFGTGKTTLMRRVYAELRDRPSEFQVGILENAGHYPTQFQLAGGILESLGEKSHSRHRKGRFDQVKEYLFANYQRGIVSVLLIDEAQEFPAKVLEGLRGYLNFETGTEKLVQVVLFALPQITRKLAYAPTLRNRLWRAELSAMSPAELTEMLRWRFAQAGGNNFPFETEALNLLYELTGGHPRSACGLAQLALELAALGDGQVRADVIHQVEHKRFLETR